MFWEKEKNKKKYLSLKEAARIFGYAPDYIGYLIRTGKIKGKKVYTGIAWLTTEEEIRKYKEKRKPRASKTSLIFGRNLHSLFKIPKYVAVFLILGIVILSGLVTWGITSKPQTQSVEIYPNQVAGDWQNSQNAKGSPEVGPEVDFGSFSEANSAIYRGGALSLFFSDFSKTQTDLAKEIEEQKSQQPEQQIEQEEETQPKLEESEPEIPPIESTTPIIESVSPPQEMIEEKEPKLPEESPNSLLERVKKFFGFQTTKAQETPTFKELQNFQFQSAKIKFSFAIGEKKAEFTPLLETPSPEATSPEIPLLESTSPSEEGVASPKIPIENTTPNEETPPSQSEEIPQEESSPTSFWEKIKDFFENPTVKAQEDVSSSEIVTPQQEGIVLPVERAETGSPPIEAGTQPMESLPSVEDGPLPTETVTQSIEEIQNLPNLDAKIIIWYSLDGEIWEQLDTISNYPLSNFSNGGYFSFGAPFLKSWDDVKNLKIKFEGVIGGETNFIAYLDSVWVEANYTEKQEEEEEFELLAVKKDWRADEEPEFEIVFKGKTENIFEKLGSQISPVFEEKPETKIEAHIINPEGEIKSLRENEDFKAETHSPTKITIFKSRAFQPGLHTLKINFEKNGKVFELEQEFTWGVLAINTNKSIYLPGETAYLQMAALRDDGHTICDAKLQLQILNPTPHQSKLGTGQESEIAILSTEDGTIQYSGKCAGDSVTDMPDYFAFYQTGEPGIYEMKLKNLDNGYEIEDSFEVRDAVPFDIERIGPTRIYPPATYQMTMEIKINQDFTGQIIETVPQSFEIRESRESGSPPAQVREGNGVKEIFWQVDWKEGEIYELQYQFDAPDVSPYLYLLGPLKFTEDIPLQTVFEEARQWQIASDSTETLRPNAAGDLTQCIPNGAANNWDCVDETPSDENTTYVNEDGLTATLNDLYNLPATSIPVGSTINSVTVYNRSKRIVAGRGSGKTKIKTNGVEYNGSSYAPGTSYGNFSTVYNTNPQTGNAWTIDEINALQIGVVVISSSYLGELVGIRCTQVYVVIDYSPPTGITISGTSNLASGTVAVAVNNALQAQTGTISGGTWSIASVTVTSGNIVTVWVDGAADANESTGVAKYDGAGDMTGMVLNQHVLSIGSVDNQSLTVTNLGQYDNDDDEDIMHSANSSVLNVDDDNVYTDEKIDILSGNTLTIGGTETLTTHDVAINGSLTSGGAGTFNVSGVWDNNNDFNASTETINFTSTTTETIDSTGATDSDVYNTIFNGSGGAWTLTTALIVNNDLTVTNGTVVGTQNLTVSGGDITCGASCGTINLTGGTTTLNGTGNFGASSLTSDWTFSSLTFSGTTTSQGSGTITISSVLTIDTGDSLNAGSKTWTLSGTTGTPFVINGTFTGSTSTFVYSGDNASGNTTIAASANYNNVQINNSFETYVLGGNTTLSGDFTATAGTLSENTDNLTVNGGDFTGNGTITFTGGTVLLDGTGNFSGDTDWTFYNLTFGDGSGTATTTTVGVSSASISITNALAIAANQTLDADSKSWTIYGTGTPFSISGTLTSSLSTIYYEGTAATTLAAATYYNLGVGTISNSTAVTYTLGGNTTVTDILEIGNDLSSATDTLDTSAASNYSLTSALIGITSKGSLTANGSTITLTGTSGSPLTVSGTFTPGTSTVVFNGDGSITIAAITYNNLTLSPTLTASRIYTGGGAITASGLTINPNASAAYSLTFNLGGTTSCSGIVSIKRTGSATSNLDTTASNYSLTVAGFMIWAGGTLTGNASTLDSNGNVTILSGGTLNSTSGNFYVGDYWLNYGTFTHNSGTVIFDATVSGKTISDGGSPFYNITFNGSGGGWTYTDGASTAPNQTTVQNGTAVFLNAKTGTVSVTGGELDVDWYLGVHVVDAANTSTNIDTGDADITISENSGTPASTVWRHDGDTWETAASSKTTGTDATGKNPQPTSAGAIRIREYAKTSSTTTYYLYNLKIAWQSTYGEYNYYSDYGSKYLTSTANTGSGHDEVIGVNWYRSTAGTMNTPYVTVNEPPTNGSWYVGMLKGLEVTITGTSIDFGALDTSNDFTATAGTQTNITVTTSATSGYIVTAWETQLMTCSDSGACGTQTIQNFTYGTYANPQPWATLCKDDSNYCGFGFTSSDPSVEGSNRYNNGTEYTYFPTDSSTPVRVMDYSSKVSSQSYLITYRISAPVTQRPGPYTTTIVYIITAQY